MVLSRNAEMDQYYESFEVVVVKEGVLGERSEGLVLVVYRRLPVERWEVSGCFELSGKVSVSGEKGSSSWASSSSESVSESNDY